MLERNLAEGKLKLNDDQNKMMMFEKRMLEFETWRDVEKAYVE